MFVIGSKFVTLSKNLYVIIITCLFNKRSYRQFTNYNSNFSEYDILSHIKESSYTISDHFLKKY